MITITDGSSSATLLRITRPGATTIPGYPAVPGSFERSCRLYSQRYRQLNVRGSRAGIREKAPLPKRQAGPGDVTRPGLHPASMLVQVGTYDFDFDGVSARSFRDFDPGIPPAGKRIDRIGHHGASDAEVVLGNRVTDAISNIVERLRDGSGIAQGLLDRIDAQVHRSDLTSQFAGNRRFSGSRKSTEND